MTEEDLWKIQFDVKERNKNAIRNALRELCRFSTTNEIWMTLDIETQKFNEAIKDEFNQRYESGEFSSKRRDELIEKSTRETIDIRTIERHVKVDPIIEKKGIRYRIIPEALQDIRNFPSFVGETQLADMMLYYWPTVNPFKNNLKQLVNIFGVYLIYRFSIAARPVSKNIPLSNAQKDEVALRWIMDSIDLPTMYEYFLLAIRNQQYSNKAVRKFQDKYKKGEISKNDLPQHLDNLLIDHLMTHQKDKYSHSKRPRYQLSDSEINNVISMLKTLYPNLYDHLRSSHFYPVGYDPKSDLLYDEARIRV